MKKGCVACEGVYLVMGLSQLLGELLNRDLVLGDLGRRGNYGADPDSKPTLAGVKMQLRRRLQAIRNRL